jgi:hypothetical protein
MRRSRFSEEVIIGILKVHAAVASTPSMLHPSANGRFSQLAPYTVRVIGPPLRAVSLFPDACKRKGRKADFRRCI